MGEIRKGFNVSKNTIEDQEIECMLELLKKKKYTAEEQISSVK